MIERRGFLAGLVGLVAAPAIVRASSLMPVKLIERDVRLELPPGAWFEFQHEAVRSFVLTIEDILPLLDGRVEVLHLGDSKFYGGE